MVNKFGTSIIDLIKTNDPRLQDIPGIGPKLAKQIVNQWHFFYGREKIAIKLTEAGFSKTMARKILSADFEDDMAAALDNNPYILMQLPSHVVMWKITGFDYDHRGGGTA